VFASTPLQKPPQAEPSVAHCGRAPCGAPLAGVHAPTCPGTSHASQVPLQARSQQTRSTHAPDPHCPARAQAWPAASLETQTPAEHQYAEPAQSPSTVQVPAQAVPAQVYGAQV